MNIFKRIYADMKYNKMRKAELKISAARLRNQMLDESREWSSNEVADALKIIGDIGYVYMNMGYSAIEAVKFLDLVEISMARLDKNGDLHLYMNRPGVFIGVKGDILNGFNKGLSKRHKNFKQIKIHEYVSPVKQELYSGLSFC